MKKTSAILFSLLALLFTGCCTVFNICEPPPPSKVEQLAFVQVSNAKLTIDESMDFAKTKIQIYDKNGNVTKEGTELFNLYLPVYANGSTYINCLQQHSYDDEVMKAAAKDYANSITALLTI